MEMNFKNLSLRTESLVSDIEKKIRDLESLGFNMKTYSDRLSKIKESISSKTDNYNFANINEVKVDGEHLDSSWMKFITELEKIKSEIAEKYESFYVMSKSVSYLNGKLDNINEVDFNLLYDVALELLNNIESSPSGEYEQQKFIVETSYEAIYHILKLKSISLDIESFRDDPLYLRIKNSDTHSSFISNLILEEANKSENPKLMDKIYQLEIKGMDSKELIDYDLFRLLFLSSKGKFVEDLKEKTKRIYSEYNATLEEIKSSARDLQTSKDDYIDNSKSTRKEFFRLLRRVSFLLASFGLIGFISVNSFKGLRGAERKYLTKSKEYDLQTGAVVESEDYELLDSDNVTVVEELPWEYEEGLFGGYYKRIREYNLESVDGIDDPSFYVEKSKNLRYSQSSLGSGEEPENFGKEEKKYTVIIKEQSEEYVEAGVGAIVLDVVIITLIDLLVLMLELYIYLQAFKETLLPDDCYNGVIADFKEELDERKESKRKMLDDIKRLRELIERCKKQLEMIKESPYYSYINPEVEEMINNVNIEEVLSESVPGTDMKKLLKSI